MHWLQRFGLQIVLIIAVAYLLSRLVKRLLHRIFSHLENRLTWDEAHQKAWKALRQAISFLVNLGIILAAVLIGFNVLGVDFDELFGEGSYALLGRAFQVFLIIVLAFAADRISKILVYRAFEQVRGEADLTDTRKKRIDTLGKVMTNAVTIVIGAAAALMVIDKIGLDIKAILMGAGVVGVAIGFGAQNLVRDFLGGFFILMESQFSVGDVISAAGCTGLVQAVNLRTTILRDLEGKVHIIPNGEIKVVSNFTKEWSACVLNIGVAYKEDVDHVIEVMKRVGEEFYNDGQFRPMMLGGMEVLGVDGFGDSAIMIKVVFRTKPIMQWTVGREFRKRIKKAFDKEGIEIPFPHCTVYIGQGKQGTLPVEENK